MSSIIAFGPIRIALTFPNCISQDEDFPVFTDAEVGTISPIDTGCHSASVLRETVPSRNVTTPCVMGGAWTFFSTAGLAGTAAGAAADVPPPAVGACFGEQDARHEKASTISHMKKRPYVCPDFPEGSIFLFITGDLPFQITFYRIQPPRQCGGSDVQTDMAISVGNGLEIFKTIVFSFPAGDGS
ncbi:MAG: hypothetical protein ABSF43_18085 [Rectinemataceae bacterium]